MPVICCYAYGHYSKDAKVPVPQPICTLQIATNHHVSDQNMTRSLPSYLIIMVHVHSIMQGLHVWSKISAHDIACMHVPCNPPYQQFGRSS